MTVVELIDVLIKAEREGHGYDEVRIVFHGYTVPSLDHPAQEARLGNEGFQVIAEEPR